MTTENETDARIQEQIAAVDVQTVAGLIAARGPRAAIQASTIEIIALAARFCELVVLANLTYAMLLKADEILDESDPEKRRALRRAVAQQIEWIATALEALGYGQEPTTPKET